MKIRLLVLVGVLISVASNVLGGYETGYGTHLDSYAATPIVHGHQGYGAGVGGHHQQNAGSYYHYHVPLVTPAHQPSHHGGDNHHYLYLLLLLPLLLLALLPLLLLPLLPLLLIPLGLSLLALLLPLLMMGGMMMMMMMMPAGGMMMMMRSLDESGAGQMRTLGELLMGDVTSIYSKYARSLDLDQCPERIACEVGSAFFPSNASRTITAKAFVNYVLENAIPKGRTKKLLRQYREALWAGSQTSTCSIYKCQPKIRLNEDTTTQTSDTEKIFNTQAKNASTEFNYSNSYDYYSPYQYQKTSATNSQLISKQVLKKVSANKGFTSSTTQNPMINSFEIHQLTPDQKENEIDSLRKQDRRGSFFSAFRTPVVRS